LREQNAAVRRAGMRKGRHRQFDDPLELPDGRVLVTLRDAATYITELPKKESAARAWQTAISEPIGVWGAYLSFAFRNPLPASVR
jgi:hypothetical protein